MNLKLLFLMMLTFASPATAEMLGEVTLVVRQGLASRWISPVPFKDVLQGNDQIVGILPGPTDRELILVGKEPGSTNVLVFYRDGQAIVELKIVVGQEYGKVRIYSKPVLHSYWAYNCTPTGCSRVGDPMEGQAAQPSGPINIIQPGATQNVKIP